MSVKAESNDSKEVRAQTPARLGMGVKEANML